MLRCSRRDKGAAAPEERLWAWLKFRSDSFALTQLPSARILLSPENSAYREITVQKKKKRRNRETKTRRIRRCWSLVRAPGRSLDARTGLIHRWFFPMRDDDGVCSGLWCIRPFRYRIWGMHWLSACLLFASSGEWRIRRDTVRAGQYWNVRYGIWICGLAVKA